MKYIVILLVTLILAACSAKMSKPAPISTPQPLPTTPPTATPKALQFEKPNFIFQGDDPTIPIITRNPSPEINNLYINPGAVLFHEGKFHMFFNSFTGWPGVITVGYATSEDGYHWQMVQDAPVFTTDQIPFGDGQADVSVVMVMDDGTWVMYFHTISKGQIGRATAASPLGSWLVDANPVLVPGPEGAWDQTWLGWPSIAKDGDELYMYYGAKSVGNYAIGLATSTDGVHWTKYNDPMTTDVLYAESDPVFIPSAEWESNKVDRPRVVKTPDGWVMLYQAGSAVEQRGLAISRDGIHWEKYPANPIFTKEVFPIPNAKTWDTNLLYYEDAFYYFMEIGSLSGTDLYLATHQGTLIVP